MIVFLPVVAGVCVCVYRCEIRGCNWQMNRRLLGSVDPGAENKYALFSLVIIISHMDRNRDFT